MAKNQGGAAVADQTGEAGFGGAIVLGETVDLDEEHALGEQGLAFPAQLEAMQLGGITREVTQGEAVKRALVLGTEGSGNVAAAMGVLSVEEEVGIAGIGMGGGKVEQLGLAEGGLGVGELLNGAVAEGDGVNQVTEFGVEVGLTQLVSEDIRIEQ